MNLNSEFYPYFKIADDYLSSDYSLNYYCDFCLKIFCQKINIDEYQLSSYKHIFDLFRFINKKLYKSTSGLNFLAKWEAIYNEYELSGLEKSDFYRQIKNNHKLCRSTFFKLFKAIEFKREYNAYKNQLTTATPLEPIEVVNVADNTNDSDLVNIIDIPKQELNLEPHKPSASRLSILEHNELTTQIKVTLAGGHTISFDTTTPERSVALILNSLSATTTR